MLIINPTVSEDDTAFRLYYVDGVSPAMGRYEAFMIVFLMAIQNIACMPGSLCGLEKHMKKYGKKDM